MRNLLSFIPGRHKLLDADTYEEVRSQFHFKENIDLFFHRNGKPTKLYKNFIYTFYKKYFMTEIKKYFDVQQLQKVNPDFAKGMKRLFYEFYEDLLKGRMRPYILEYVSEEKWNYVINGLVFTLLKEEVVQEKAIQNIENMSQQKLQKIAKAAIKEVLLKDLETAYQNKLVELEQAQKSLLQEVKEVEHYAVQQAEKIAQKTSEQVFQEQHDNLMQDLFPLDNTFFAKDKTRSYYYEQVKKAEQLREVELSLDHRAKEMHYDNREMQLREQSFEITQREKELLVKIIQQDVEIQRKNIELIHAMNVHELNQKELEVAKRLLMVERAGLSQSKELIEMEKNLLQVQRSEFQAQVRDIVFDIQRQKFDLKKLESKLDYQKREINLYELAHRKREETEELEERGSIAQSRLNRMNKEVWAARQEKEQLRDKELQLVNEIHQLEFKKRKMKK